jgi:CTP:molybdopterin cytidylyltransferase MocA
VSFQGQNSPAYPRLGAVILAAGASTRLGQPKQLLVFQGRPLVERAALAALEAGASPVVVVLGAHAEKIRPALVDAHPPLVIVENPAWVEGMGATIRVGLAALETAAAHALTELNAIARPPTLDAALFALCDQPHFSANAIRRLCAAFSPASARGGGKISLAATRQPDGRGGAPAIFAREHFAELRSLRGTEGARHVIATHTAATALVDLPELALDIDTPADWERARTFHG